MEHFGLSHILYEPDKYSPDTLDLLIDEEAREYWLNTCEKLVEKYVNFALANTDDPTVEIRALKFKTCYVEALKELRVNPVYVLFFFLLKSFNISVKSKIDQIFQNISFAIKD